MRKTRIANVLQYAVNHSAKGGKSGRKKRSFTTQKTTYCKPPDNQRVTNSQFFVAASMVFMSLFYTNLRLFQNGKFKGVFYSFHTCFFVCVVSLPFTVFLLSCVIFIFLSQSHSPLCSFKRKVKSACLKIKNTVTVINRSRL